MVGKNVVIDKSPSVSKKISYSNVLAEIGMKVVDVQAYLEINNVWKSLGGFFTSFSSLSSEFVDNSISNMLGNNTNSRNVFIKIKRLVGESLKVSYEDEGTGIEDLNGVFGLGNQSGNRKGKKTTWNVHGFGIKNALSAGDPNNNNWKFYTRTEQDILNKQYKLIQAPYVTGIAKMYIVDEKMFPWPGTSKGPGTYIEFECNYQLFNSVRLGVKGNFGFEKITEMFIEDLGFIYANNIKDGQISISVETFDLNGQVKKQKVKSILPEWEKVRKLKSSQHRLKLQHNGKYVDIEYKIGHIEEAENNYKYYKRNRDSLGVEIRINGRLLKYNIFEEIWNLKNHGQYNPFLFQINLISDDIDCLPITKATKDNIRIGDPVLEQLYQWILTIVPKPEESMKDGDESVYLEKFAELKEKQLKLNGEDPTVILEHTAYLSLGAKLKADLYISSNFGVIIYEAKLSKATPMDVAQLRLYWDGLVFDGIKPKVARLITKCAPQIVLDIIRNLNTLQDAWGNNYCFEHVTWEDEGIIL